MLRTTVAGISLAFLLAAPLALAQSSTADDDGCTSRDACQIIVEVDANGFFLVQDVLYGGSVNHLDFTVGDWYTMVVDNYDENRSHTVTLSGHDEASVTVNKFYEDGDHRQSPAFQFATQGTFKLRDQPSGDEFEFRVGEEDAIEAGSDSGSETDEEGAPGLAPVALLAVLAGVALVRRRS